MVSVAAGGIDSNEYHQKDDHDDANHSAFGHAALGWWERGKSLNAQTENIKHLFWQENSIIQVDLLWFCMSVSFSMYKLHSKNNF